MVLQLYHLKMVGVGVLFVFTTKSQACAGKAEPSRADPSKARQPFLLWQAPREWKTGPEQTCGNAPGVENDQVLCT